MNHYLFYNTSCLGDVKFFKATFKHLFASPKDTRKAALIKHFNNETVVINNQSIAGLLVLAKRGCFSKFSYLFVQGKFKVKKIETRMI